MLLVADEAEVETVDAVEAEFDGDGTDRDVVRLGGVGAESLPLLLDRLAALASLESKSSCAMLILRELLI